MYERPRLRDAGPAGRGRSPSSSRTRASACPPATPSAPTPRARDVTIVRDRGFGVPHVYGTTRAGRCSGSATSRAEDRLFFMDVLRHAGRARAVELRRRRRTPAMDAEQWAVAPYTEADLERQVDRAADLLGAEGEQIQRDADELHRRHQPVHRRGAARPDEAARRVRRRSASRRARSRGSPPTSSPPRRWSAGSSARAAASELRVVAARRRAAAALRQAPRRGARSRDFRAAEDPEAPTTVRGKRFPYQAPPKRARAGVARPDRGSLQLHSSSRRRPAARPRRRARRARALARLAAARRPTRCSSSGARVRERAPADGLRPAGRLLRRRRS